MGVRVWGFRVDGSSSDRVQGVLLLVQGLFWVCL